MSDDRQLSTQEMLRTPGGVQALAMAEALPDHYLAGLGVELPTAPIGIADRVDLEMWYRAARVISNCGSALTQICQARMDEIADDVPPGEQPIGAGGPKRTETPPGERPIGDPESPPADVSPPTPNEHESLPSTPSTAKLQRAVIASFDARVANDLLRHIALILPRDFRGESFKAKDVHRQLEGEGAPHLCRASPCKGNRKGCEVRRVLDAIEQSKAPLTSEPKVGSYGPLYTYAKGENR